MAGKQEYDLASVHKAIEDYAPNIAKIAKAISPKCQRSTVYSYLRRHPELQAVYDKKTGGEKSITPAADDSRTKHSKEDVLAAIRQSKGIKASVAAALGCSKGTVDNYLTRWPELKEEFESSRSGLISIASSALIADVENKESKNHHSAVLFVLKTIGKDDGFVERAEVTGADGKNLFEISPMALRMANLMGFDWSAVGAQLDRMIMMQAEQKGLVSGQS